MASHKSQAITIQECLYSITEMQIYLFLTQRAFNRKKARIMGRSKTGYN